MINSPEKFLQDYQDIFNDDNIAKDNLKRITVQLNSIFETEGIILLSPSRH